jgi:hypothetical protein
MLTLTPSAVAAVSMLLHDSRIPDGAGLRLQRGADADGEPAVGIAIVSAPEPDDELVPAPTEGGVFLAHDVADLLEDRVLDAEIEGENVAFTILPQSNNGGVTGG